MTAKSVARFSRQVSDVRAGGGRVLLRKVRTALLLALAMVVALAVRVLRPLVLVRFGSLNSSRIGPFAADIEIYLCERDAGLHGGRTIDVFYHPVPPCNEQLQRMWDRTLWVTPFARYVDLVSGRLPGAKSHVIPTRRDGDRDVHGLLDRTPTHLAFTSEEKRRGRAALRELGIGDGRSFVCFHARDSAYLDTVAAGRDWRYHDYRDSSIRNYLAAAEELARRGYFAVRMGTVVKESLTTRHPMIIDYATSGKRSDFLDMYLGAKCRFFICSSVGIHAVSLVFRRPIAWVNVVPLEYAPTACAADLFIPKKLWLRSERRFLTFREILESGAGRFLWTEQYEALGVEVVENMPEEITALAVEMDDRLKGTWQTTEEDGELQRRFWSLFKPSELNRTFASRIGACFLRENRELLA